jgi:integrase
VDRLQAGYADKETETSLMSKRGKYGNGRVFFPTYKDKKTGEVHVVDHPYIQWYDRDGVQHREAARRPDGSYAQTEKEARAILREKITDTQRGVQNNNDRSLRYADIRELLLEHHRQESKAIKILSNGEESIKGLTELDVYGGYRDKNADGTYKLTGTPGRKVSTITKKDWFENFIVRRYQEGVGNKVIGASAKLLRQALRLAKMDHIAKEITYKDAAPREDCLYIEDFHRLIGENCLCPKHPEKPEHTHPYIDNEFHPVLKFLFYQGVRLKETLGITWNQIEFESGEYRPHRTANKTGDTAAKPLNPTEIVPMLRKMKGNAKDTDRVFESIRSGGKNPAKRLEKAFRKAMLEMRPVSGLGKNKGAAGPAWNCSLCQTIDRALPAPKDGEAFAHVCTNETSDICQRYRVPMQWSYCGPSPHSLRASCAVYYLEKGMNETEVMGITGHSNVKVFRGYARIKTANIAAKMGSTKKNKRAA